MPPRYYLSSQRASYLAEIFHSHTCLLISFFLEILLLFNSIPSMVSAYTLQIENNNKNTAHKTF